MFPALPATLTPVRFSLGCGVSHRRGLQRPLKRKASVRASGIRAASAPNAVLGDSQASSEPDGHLMTEPPNEGRHRARSEEMTTDCGPNIFGVTGPRWLLPGLRHPPPGLRPARPSPGRDSGGGRRPPPGNRRSRPPPPPVRKPLTVCTTAARRPTGI